jgi:hypothetical protein
MMEDVGVLIYDPCIMLKAVPSGLQYKNSSSMYTNCGY